MTETEDKTKRAAVIHKYFKDGYSDEEVARFTKYPINEIQQERGPVLLCETEAAKGNS
jgi:hypothetical protein